MVSRIILIVTVLAVLGGCGRIAQSRYNPLNWFGGAENVPTGALVPAGFGDVSNQPLVAAATTMKVERTYSGAIVQAEGITPALGYWDAELYRLPSEDPTVVSYQFRMKPPPAVRLTGSKEQRTVNVGAVLSTIELETVRRIEVISASNRLTTRR